MIQSAEHYNKLLYAPHCPPPTPFTSTGYAGVAGQGRAATFSAHTYWAGGARRGGKGSIIEVPHLSWPTHTGMHLQVRRVGISTACLALSVKHLRGHVACRGERERERDGKGVCGHVWTLLCGRGFGPRWPCGLQWREQGSIIIGEGLTM